MLGEISQSGGRGFEKNFPISIWGLNISKMSHWWTVGHPGTASHPTTASHPNSASHPRLLI